MKFHKTSFLQLKSLFERTEETPLTDTDKYVIFSDLHLGNGSRADDFKSNASLVMRVLEEYFDRGFHLILNGDIEEVQKFGLPAVQATWPEIFAIFRAFSAAGRLTKIIGNHDLALFQEKNYEFPLYEALRFSYKGKPMFISHGHQTIKYFHRESPFITFLLRYVATPLRIKNSSVSHSSVKRFATEKRVYQFSSSQKILSIIGHTHRPLFESMSKLDSLRFEIERLCRKYPRAVDKKRKAIETRIRGLREELAEAVDKSDKMDDRQSLYNANLVVPCMFNSGTSIGKRGITNLVIEQGTISLVHWFDKGKEKQKGQFVSAPAEQLGKPSMYSAIMKQDALDYIFSRIQLLGGSVIHPGQTVDIENEEDLSSAV